MDSMWFLLVILGFVALAVFYLIIEVTKIKAHLTADRDDLRSVSNLVNSIFSNVSRLSDQAERSGQSLSEKFAEIKTKLEEISKTAEAARELKEMLRAPRGRGAFGELSLYSIVKDVLPSNAYSFQHRFRNGSISDLVIKIGDKLLAVDSKFPVDEFSGLIVETDDAKKASFISELKRKIKKHADDVSRKYINPDEGTLDFALIYLPSEALYYEITCDADFAEIYNYLRNKNVYLVSPNSFYIFLAGVGYVLRQIRIQQNIHEIVDRLKSLENIVSRLKEDIRVTHSHITNSASALSKVSKTLFELEVLATKIEELEGEQ